MAHSFSFSNENENIVFQSFIGWRNKKNCCAAHLSRRLKHAEIISIVVRRYCSFWFIDFPSRNPWLIDEIRWGWSTHNPLQVLVFFDQITYWVRLLTWKTFAYIDKSFLIWQYGPYTHQGIGPSSVILKQIKYCNRLEAK